MRLIFYHIHIHTIHINNAISSLPDIPLDPDYVRENPPHETDWSRLAQDTLAETLNRKEPKMGAAKNVILFIGDGMGVTPLTAARWHQGQKSGSKAFETHLAMDLMPVIGHTKVYTVDYITPDSAATGTALLCGQKTHFGVIGLSQDAQYSNCSSVDGNELNSILDEADAAGKWTGVVATTRVTHATPATAYAHSVTRDWESDADIPEDQRLQCPGVKDIADQLVTDNGHLRVVLGGGRSKFTPIDVEDGEIPNTFGHRLDDRNLIEEWELSKKHQTARYVTRQSEFDDVDPENTEFLLGLFEASHMNFEVDRVNDTWGEPSISQMVDKAIRILRRGPEGYVLVVEGGRIDHGHHFNNAYRANEDTVALSDAVSTALELTSEDDTLVVVTADHGHVFSFGGYHMINEDIYDVVKTKQGEDMDLADDTKPYTLMNYANGPGWTLKNFLKTDARALVSRRMDNTFPKLPLVFIYISANPMFMQDAAIPMQIETHGAGDVAVYARGPMAHLFAGTYEQSFIAHAAMYAACLGQNKENCQKSAAGDVRLRHPVAMVMMMLIVYAVW
ncbi:hypothetical protein CAPTEDRAFT_124483 [Capitella teleta]|uniref:alkaline phosphatase n=1 Tax=Capitella teleta TaxID=283909 RepID=R7TR03_CAPTE|nr:hypothetical protein CAPTEDRAFT_124483 [Capitella teleta]|eukprot:ELT93921.1 hypothetical protein CAPTEDRAFT_124483 [Capitella teleta]